jgi:hypothetical protein
MRWVEVATEPDAIQRVLTEFERPESGCDNERAGPTQPTASRRYRAPPLEQLGLGFG